MTQNKNERPNAKATNTITIVIGKTQMHKFTRGGKPTIGADGLM